MGRSLHTQARTISVDTVGVAQWTSTRWRCGLLLGLVSAVPGACKQSEGQGARCSVAARPGVPEEPMAKAAWAPEPPPMHQRGWLRPKSGQVNFVAQETKPRKAKQRSGKITSLDQDGSVVKVTSIDEVPLEYRSAIIGQAGALGRAGGYSVIDFPAPPPPQPAKRPTAGATEKPTEARGEAPRVSVFGTAWCPACRETKDYLTRKGVEFRVRDIEDDSAALAEYMSYGGNKVPLVVIGETAIQGFEPSAIDRALGPVQGN